MPYIQLFGRKYRVTGWFSSDHAANEWMTCNPGHGVIRIFDYAGGTQIITAAVADCGERA